MESLSFAILPLLVIVNAYLVLRDKREYAQFKTLTDTKARQRVLRKWFVESLLFYGLLPLICLIVVGHGSALLGMPEFLREPSDDLKSFLSSDSKGFLGGMIMAMSLVIIPVLLFGPTALALARVYNQHKRKIEHRHMMLDVRDVEHLLPRNKDERFWTAAISISAGINEELCFRLVIPILVFIVTGSAALAIILATIWFGLAHYYQGWFGVASTFILGAIFMFVYLLTQNIWLVMFIHAILDLNDLAFAPWFAERLEKRRPTP